MKQILIAFIAGGLVTGGALGTVGYFKIKDMNEENIRLETVVKKQDKRLKNLSNDQTRLQTELDEIKDQKDQSYEQTIGALMQAKDNADIDALYEIGIKALAEKDAPRAYFALAQVQKANPKYKAIEQHYATAEKAYHRHQQTEFAAKLNAAYSKALDQQASNQFAQARSSYQQVVDMKSDFKDAKVRLATVTRYLAARSQTRDLEQKKQWLEATYKLGNNYQAHGRFADAKVAYEQIVNYAPQYKDSARRLIAVRAKLPKAPPLAQAKSPAAQNQNCYTKGLEYGKCAMGVQGQDCSQIQVSKLPAECKDNPEFLRGYKSTATSDPNTLLKGFSSFLKGL
ncbi:MAG: hypothetical protein ACAI44_38720 [Candidatus Sericytochromatia bacterium]